MLELYVPARNWIREQAGQDLIEYAVMLGFIALVVWAAVIIASADISRIWAVLSTRLTAVH